MTCYETKKENTHKPLKKIFLGLTVVCGGSYICIDFKDFKNSNPSSGTKDYAEAKFKQLRETRTRVCSFARQFLSTIEKTN